MKARAFDIYLSSCFWPFASLFSLSFAFWRTLAVKGKELGRLWRLSTLIVTEIGERLYKGSQCLQRCTLNASTFLPSLMRILRKFQILLCCNIMSKKQQGLEDSVQGNITRGPSTIPVKRLCFGLPFVRSCCTHRLRTSHCLGRPDS